MEYLLNNKFQESTVVYRFDTTDGYYIRFPDGRWFFGRINRKRNINEDIKPVEVIYAQKNCEEILIKENSKKLENNGNNEEYEEGGKLVSLVSRNRKKILLNSTILHIEKIIPSCLEENILYL
ncbi:MAG: hypothetical protein AABW90_02800 [Nanoarchaeota archaeon]